jgi:hypothetical protein
MKRAVGFWMLGMLLGMPVAAAATATSAWCVPLAVAGVAWILFAVRLIEGGKIKPPELTDAELWQVRRMLEAERDHDSEQLSTNMEVNPWDSRYNRGTP